MNEALRSSFLPDLVDFTKSADGLVPAIIQDAASSVVLMLGFMNRQALDETIKTSLVTFYSRTKNRLWVKGETSNHFLKVVSIAADCDQDTLLIKAHPTGPVCHTGADTCFSENNTNHDFLYELENIIADRKNNLSDESYTSSLFKKGINAMAQKVGEEAVELIIEAKDHDADRFHNEAADLLFHYLVLLSAKGSGLIDVVGVLKQRHLK